MTHFQSLLLLTLLLAIPGCCKPNQPPSFLCSVQERLIECSKETAASAAAGLAPEVLKALRSGLDREALLQKLLDAGVSEVTCILGNLPELFASKPAAGPDELKQRAADIAFAREFLATRKLKPVMKGAK